jgi:hypothetical protein
MLTTQKLGMEIAQPEMLQYQHISITIFISGGDIPGNLDQGELNRRHGSGSDDKWLTLLDIGLYSRR